MDANCAKYWRFKHSVHFEVYRNIDNQVKWFLLQNCSECTLIDRELFLAIYSYYTKQCGAKMKGHHRSIPVIDLTKTFDNFHCYHVVYYQRLRLGQLSRCLSLHVLQEGILFCIGGWLRRFEKGLKGLFSCTHDDPYQMLQIVTCLNRRL